MLVPPVRAQVPCSKVSGLTRCFNGLWAGRGEVNGKTFFWKDGPRAPLRFLGSRELELTLDGRRHRGVLKDDGKLHWDDGDVWSRDTLNGVWAGRGEVNDKMLFWKDGPSTPLRLIGDIGLEVMLDGRRHCGVLRADGNLHWEDATSGRGRGKHPVRRGLVSTCTQQFSWFMVAVVCQRVSLAM